MINGKFSNELIQEAKKIATDAGYASVTLFQLKLRLQYVVASELLEHLEQIGFVERYKGELNRRLVTATNNESRFTFNTSGDIIFLSIPSFNFNGIATYSPSRRYVSAAHNNMIALVDNKHKHLMYVYDIFNRVDDAKIVVTDQPFIVVRDIVALGSNRQNDIYLLNHRSDILFKASVDANVYKLAISENGKYVAAQTLDNKIRLFDVDEMREIAVWKIPKKVAIELSIDLINNEVRMLDYQNHVYSYQFNPL